MYRPYCCLSQFSRLLLAKEGECINWLISIVASLSVQSLFSTFHSSNDETEKSEESSNAVSDANTKISAMWAHKDSDLLASLK